MEDYKSRAAGEKPEENHEEAKMEERVAIVVLLTNGTLVVLDEDGGRIQELEGDLASVIHDTLKRSDEATRFFFASFETPGLWPTTRAAFKRMAKAGQ